TSSRSSRERATGSSPARDRWSTNCRRRSRTRPAFPLRSRPVAALPTPAFSNRSARPSSSGWSATPCIRSMNACRSPISAGSPAPMACSWRVSSPRPFLDRNEIIRSLTGAWYVFLDKPDAPRFFDLSVEGFWRSFRAILLMIPAYGLTALTDYQTLVGSADGNFDTSTYVLTKVIADGFDWILFPILLFLVAEPLGITRRYPSFIIARNWGSVLAGVP